MLALTLSILLQVDSRPVWVPESTFPSPAHAVTVFTKESVSIRAETYDVNADVLESSHFNLDSDISRQYSITSGKESRVGTFGVPIAKNGIVYANQYSAFVKAAEEGRLWSFVLLPYPYKFQAPLPFEAERALKLVESAFRESRARLVGDQLTALTFMSLGGYRVRVAKVPGGQSRFVHSADLSLLGIKSTAKDPQWLIELGRSGKTIDVAWGTPFFRTQEEWQATGEGVLLRGEETWVPLAAVEYLLAN